MIRSTGFKSGTITRRRIAEYLGGAGFARVYKKQKALPKAQRRQKLPQQQDKLRVPVGVIPDDLQAAMGTRQSVLSLSGYTIGKQKGAHPEVKPADYAMVQRIVDGDRVYPQSDTHRLGFAQDDEGKWWVAAWKRTQDDAEVLLVHFRRAQEKETLKVAQAYEDN